MKKKDFDPGFRYETSWISIAMTLNGTWPKNHPLIWIIVFTSYLPLIFSISFEAYTVIDNGSFRLNDFSISIALASIIYKCYFLYNNADKLSVVIESMATDWRMTKDEENRRIMFRHARWSRSFFVIFLALILISWIFFAHFAITDSALRPNETRAIRRRQFALPARYPFDDQASPTFEILFLYQMIEIFLLTIGNVTTDAMLLTVALHIAGQFIILKNRTRDLMKGKIGSRCEWANEVGSLVERHQHVVRISSLVEDSFGLILLEQLLSTSFNICLMGYATKTAFETRDYATLLSFAMFVFATLEQMFMYCFAGDYLTTHADGVALAVYESQWYIAPRRVGKALLIMMYRTRIPVQLTAAKFFSISLVTFKKVMQMSATYWSMLLTMSDDSRA